MLIRAAVAWHSTDRVNPVLCIVLCIQTIPLLAHRPIAALLLPCCSGMSSSASLPSPAFVRVESVQCVAQCVPALMASIPQVLPTSLPPSAVGGAAGPFPPATQSVVSPLAPLAGQPAQLLAWEAEQRLKQIITSALQFMRHSQRSVLATDDINMALKHHNAAPVYGSEQRDTAAPTIGVTCRSVAHPRVCVCVCCLVSSFDNASQLLPPAGDSLTSAASTLHFTQAAADLFMVTDAVVNFEDVIQKPLPKSVTQPLDKWRAHEQAAHKMQRERRRNETLTLWYSCVLPSECPPIRLSASTGSLSMACNR